MRPHDHMHDVIKIADAILSPDKRDWLHHWISEHLEFAETPDQVLAVLNEARGLALASASTTRH